MRKRVFFLSSCLMNDNEEMVTDPVAVGCTSSDEVARALVQVLLDRRNGHVTLVNEAEVKRVLAGLIPEEIQSEILKSVAEAEEKYKSMLDMMIDELDKSDN